MFNIVISVILVILVFFTWFNHIRISLYRNVLKDTRESLNETRQEVQKLNRFKKDATKVLERL